jgi:hypothetical protein
MRWVKYPNFTSPVRELLNLLLKSVADPWKVGLVNPLLRINPSGYLRSWLGVNATPGVLPFLIPAGEKLQKVIGHTQHYHMPAVIKSIMATSGSSPIQMKFHIGVDLHSKLVAEFIFQKGGKVL